MTESPRRDWAANGSLITVRPEVARGGQSKATSLRGRVLRALMVVSVMFAPVSPARPYQARSNGAGKSLLSKVLPGDQLESAASDRTVLLISDAQLHELGSSPFRGRSKFSDTLSGVAVRPIPQDLFGDELLEETLAAAPGVALTLYGGDLGDLGCVSEYERGFRKLNDHGLWFGTPGNHDGFLQGNLSESRTRDNGTEARRSRWSAACGGRDRIADKYAFIVLYLQNLSSQCSAAGATCDPGVREFADLVSRAATESAGSSSHGGSGAVSRCGSGDRFVSNRSEEFRSFVCGGDVISSRTRSGSLSCGGAVDYPHPVSWIAFRNPRRGVFGNAFLKDYRSTRLPGCRGQGGEEEGLHPLGANAGVFVAESERAALRALVWYLNPHQPENSFLLQLVDVRAGTPGDPLFVLLGDSANPALAATRYSSALLNPFDSTLTGVQGKGIFKMMQYRLFLIELFGLNAEDRRQAWVLLEHHPYEAQSRPSRRELDFVSPSLMISAHTHRGWERCKPGSLKELNLGSSSDWAGPGTGPSIVLWNVAESEATGFGAFTRIRLGDLGDFGRCRDMLKSFLTRAPKSLGYREPGVGLGRKGMWTSVSTLIERELESWSQFQDVPENARHQVEGGLEKACSEGSAANRTRVLLDSKQALESEISEADWRTHRLLAACRAYLAAGDEARTQAHTRSNGGDSCQAVEEAAVSPPSSRALGK